MVTPLEAPTPNPWKKTTPHKGFFSSSEVRITTCALSAICSRAIVKSVSPPLSIVLSSLACLSSIVLTSSEDEKAKDLALGILSCAFILIATPAPLSLPIAAIVLLGTLAFCLPPEDLKEKRVVVVEPRSPSLGVSNPPSRAPIICDTFQSDSHHRVGTQNARAFQPSTVANRKANFQPHHEVGVRGVQTATSIVQPSTVSARAAITQQQKAAQSTPMTVDQRKLQNQMDQEMLRGTSNGKNMQHAVGYRSV